MPNTGQILIADDADSLLLPISDMLRLEGYECNYVPDTKTVIEMLRCIKFNLLIADINTVGSRELETIKELLDYTNELSIILIADVPLSDAQIQPMKPLVTACLRKPLSFEELLKYVRCSIKGKLIGT
jgi:DNA-binding NtrC family response regulator